MTRYCHFCGEAEGLSRYCMIRRMPNMPHQALLAGDLVDLEWIPRIDLKFWGVIPNRPTFSMKTEALNPLTGLWEPMMSEPELVAQRLRAEYMFAQHQNDALDALRYSMYPPPIDGGAQDLRREAPRALVGLVARVAGFATRLWLRVTRWTSKLGV